MSLDFTKLNKHLEEFDCLDELELNKQDNTLSLHFKSSGLKFEDMQLKIVFSEPLTMHLPFSALVMNCFQIKLYNKDEATKLIPYYDNNPNLFVTGLIVDYVEISYYVYASGIHWILTGNGPIENDEGKIERA